MSKELTQSQKDRIERNRQKALQLRKSKVVAHPYFKNSPCAVECLDKNIIRFEGSKFTDSGGGFLIEEVTGQQDKNEIPTIVEDLPAICIPDQPTCEECKEKFGDSFLLKSFDYPVCDGCRDNEEKHSLITRTDARNEYLLKDCDLDKREPLLKFILRKNPHNVRWGDMKLYLLKQIENRAMDVWGSEEELEKQRELREEKRIMAKTKKYNKNMKALRMNVRSSLYNKTTTASHEHEFGSETYHEEEDNYSHTCKSCGYEETFEKM
ncbi:DNA repair protein complementing XP-A cells homolog [Macrosteles quadrilineatus]|uniref:DNA repair protein complementing XP-A cells homolog n=1 Tax=Macrosteles quadrilineatus TaxID=74068 RepID=UPI0023E0A33A|nr:DNA repair protein complementing XP-A cells homolog [Macrosteles quadrilineatus]